MPPPRASTQSRPLRALGALGAVIVVLLLTIVGHAGLLFSPGHWDRNFKVHLGLDLTGGTELVLKAVTSKGQVPKPSDMSEAVSIMLSRVDGTGVTDATVQPQGNNTITVSVPGRPSTSFINLVSETAQLDFRQVLLSVPNTLPATPKPTASATPSGTPSATPSAGASGTPTPQVSSTGSAPATPKATSSATASSSPKALGEPGVSGTGGVTEMSRHASLLSARAPAVAASPGVSAPAVTPSAPATTPPVTPPTTPPTTSAPACAAPPKNLAPAKNTGSVQEVEALGSQGSQLGNPSLVKNCHVQALFNHVNCATKTGKLNGNWPSQVGYSPQDLNTRLSHDEVVSCGIEPGGVVYKYALAPVSVDGSQISAASDTLVQNSATLWQVNLSFHAKGQSQFGTITTSMFNTYHCTANAACPANGRLAAVLDGDVINDPGIDAAITGGQAEISPFSQSQAQLLAQQLSYGALPITFQQSNVNQVSPQLGRAQLDAGLIAAAIGLILVVGYMIFYYRGLAMVAVSSLVIAGLLAYLGVVALGWYQNFALNLAGVAGLIVAIGITADSFVVFFERLRDEVREGGRSLRSAVESGWVRARRTILVSDTVSFLAAALLWYFSIGDVKGFAFTLGMITVIDVLVVFTFTKPMLTLLAQTRFYGGGHRWSGLDPNRLGARAPWRSAPRRAAVRTPRTTTPARPSSAKEA